MSLYRNRYRRCKKKLTFEFEDQHLHNIQIFSNNKSLKNIIQKMSLIQLRVACAIYIKISFIIKINQEKKNAVTTVWHMFHLHIGFDNYTRHTNILI